ncbi:MAG: hypothetical protein IPL30_10095 [Elusimicrobia bacterium]|nr:hypothetical protein [Elusimicrobiota bacterium]
MGGAPRADRRGRGGEEFQDRFSVLNPKAKWRVQTTVEGREAPLMELNDRRLPPPTPEEGAGSIEWVERCLGPFREAQRGQRRGAGFGFDDVRTHGGLESPAAGERVDRDGRGGVAGGDDRSGVGPGGVAITLDGVDVRNLFTGPTSAVLSRNSGGAGGGGEPIGWKARVTDEGGERDDGGGEFGANTNTRRRWRNGAAVTVTVGTWWPWTAAGRATRRDAADLCMGLSRASGRKHGDVDGGGHGDADLYSGPGGDL